MNEENTTQKAPSLFERYSETITMAIGEVAVVILTVLGFIIYNSQGGEEALYKVILGALIGAAVTVGNMLILTLNVNGAVNRYLELRGTREMTDEEAEKFASENSIIIQNAMKRSYIIRTLLMVAVLVGALLLPWFNALATVIPLLAYRPIMYVSELMKKRRSGK